MQYDIVRDTYKDGKWWWGVLDENIGAYVHPEYLCEGYYCCIHNPSDHHMRDWKLYWRSDRRIMERICPCGVGHPDPDDAAYRARNGDSDTTHGCCGCCHKN